MSESAAQGSNDATNANDARGEMESVTFLVDEKAQMFFGADLKQENRWYLEAIDPSFWLYQAAVHERALEDDHLRRHAAAALRLAYGQGMETLFSLLASMAQAPAFPLGWITRYTNTQLRAVIAKIQDDEPIVTAIAGGVTWHRLSEIVHRRFPEAVRDSAIAGFARMWQRMAADFLDPYFEPEYNGMKHGMRAAIGGFEFKLRKPPVAGDVAENSFTMETDFGSAFRVVTKIPGTVHSYEVHLVSRAWVPAQFLAALRLLACSIGNVKASLLIASGVAPGPTSFHYPNWEDPFDSPWSDSPALQQVVMRNTVDPQRVVETPAADIRASYAGGGSRTPTPGT